ncbi:MAG: DUF3455 domain-containing protein [Acidobacteriia bacterium]|nr:DUF3455 domain-containing protein [Terriglobia bacterium]
MSYKLDQHPGTPGQIWVLLSATLVILAWAFSLVILAEARKDASTTPPAVIAPPAGNSVFLVGHAVGTQGYVCLPTGTGASWTVTGSRPEATLFAAAPVHDTQIITHYLSPDARPNQFAPKPLPFGSATWQSSLDSSKVWGQMLRSVPAGSDPSCPNAGAIGCLLLQSIGSEKGPAGGNVLTNTTFIQRLNTNGGSAPATGCSAAADVGKQTLVPYTADYYFFRRTNKSAKDKTNRFELL